ncbi:MAG: DUF4158 domain-containing protein [Gammaproteobacteria bacterium]|nr:DUF4158 domain-containing protein [Gammaproteobacteria bacterium]
MRPIHETAYPRLKQNLSINEVERLYTLTSQEIVWLRKRRLSKYLQLDAMVNLKCFQTLGYFPHVSEIPEVAIKGSASSFL